MNTLNLYLISQTETHTHGTYDSAVVAAYNENEAKQIHPTGDNHEFMTKNYTWVASDKVIVQLLGKANTDIKANNVICASYNAG